MIKEILLGGALLFAVSTGSRMKGHGLGEKDEELMDEKITYYGTVKKDVEKGSHRIVAKRLKSDHPKADQGLFCEELILLTKGVHVVDENGTEKTIDNLKEGDKLKVVTPAVVSMVNAIPPQIPGKSIYEITILK